LVKLPHNVATGTDPVGCHIFSCAVEYPVILDAKVMCRRYYPHQGTVTPPSNRPHAAIIRRRCCIAHTCTGMCIRVIRSGRWPRSSPLVHTSADERDGGDGGGYGPRRRMRGMHHHSNRNSRFMSEEKKKTHTTEHLTGQARSNTSLGRKACALIGGARSALLPFVQARPRPPGPQWPTLARWTIGNTHD
jgi:hypothetical protein